MPHAPHRLAVACRHVDLVGELAREADPEEPRRHAADRALGERHIRERGVADIEAVGDPGEHLPRAGAGERDPRPLLGHRAQLEVELRPYGLGMELHVREHCGGIRGGRGDQEVLLAEA
jgi:hypothetical protein